MVTFLKRYIITAVGLAIVIAAIVAFPHPSVAAAVKKKAAAASTALVKPTEVAQPSSPIAKFAKKAGKIFQKIIFGVNSKAASRMLKKAGDTRAEISGLINAVTMIITLGAWAFVANLLQKREEAQELARMRKEVLREQEYKENMYFEAVEQILSKLADPKLKGSVRADLSKQLKDLDPDGRIRDFLEGKTTRPSLSDLQAKNPPKKKVDPNTALKKKKAPKAEAPTAKSSEDDKKTDNGDDLRRPPSPPLEQKRTADTKIYKEVLSALDDSLSDVLSQEDRDRLIANLQTRISNITNESKQAATVEKIAEKLGDEQYWIKYLENI